MDENKAVTQYLHALLIYEFHLNDEKKLILHQPCCRSQRNAHAENV